MWISWHVCYDQHAVIEIIWHFVGDNLFKIIYYCESKHDKLIKTFSIVNSISEYLALLPPSVCKVCKCIKMYVSEVGFKCLMFIDNNFIQERLTSARLFPDICILPICKLALWQPNEHLMNFLIHDMLSIILIVHKLNVVHVFHKICLETFHYTQAWVLLML